MKKIFIGALLVMEFAGLAQGEKGKVVDLKPDEIYLLIGQSNMAGRGKLESQNEVVQENILMLDKANYWVSAKDPLHFDKPEAGVGPGISFAQTMLVGQKKTKIGLIPCAWGGSPIKVWKTGAEYLKHHPYDEVIERVKIAMQSGGVLKGILWHQGESDNNAESSKIYLQELKELVTNLRRDLNAPDLPFVAGEIGRFNNQNYINKIIATLPIEVKNTAVVSSEGLTDKGDHLHFDTPSARELGKRYAVEMKKLLLESDSMISKKKTKKDK